MTYEEVMTVINKMIEEYGEEETIKSFIRMYLQNVISMASNLWLRFSILICQVHFWQNMGHGQIAV